MDLARQLVPGLFDCNSHLEGRNLCFRWEKNHDQFFDQEVEEKAKFEVHGADDEFAPASFVIIWIHFAICME